MVCILCVNVSLSFFQQMASGSQKRIIQITGFKKQEKKALLKCLFKLNCVFIESKVLFITVQQKGLKLEVKTQVLEERTVQ